MALLFKTHCFSKQLPFRTLFINKESLFRSKQKLMYLQNDTLIYCFKD